MPDSADPQQTGQNAMQVENYEQEFPQLSQVDDATSPTSFKNAENNSPEPSSPDNYNNGEAFAEADRDGARDPQEGIGAGAEVYANTGGAIPLPYCGPLLPGNQQNHATNYDVPMAPRTAAAAVGPPNVSNTAS